ncbi:hypothetical protein PPACK8108_LOCUS14871 [Phakopsora pachyrhizi]|uniref:Uncharacterized protein n=1 Tax=Phakopsora pachyrhizi TaxID=170000 RepID=A0AAV0B8I1_PHAPC|nr:hypothetical protein PPACK8108_LOCUS14871 [Phakopsora pachyrhizi]
MNFNNLKINYGGQEGRSELGRGRAFRLLADQTMRVRAGAVRQGRTKSGWQAPLVDQPIVWSEKSRKTRAGGRAELIGGIN